MSAKNTKRRVSASRLTEKELVRFASLPLKTRAFIASLDLVSIQIILNSPEAD